jgi:hypothetical protein
MQHVMRGAFTCAFALVMYTILAAMFVYITLVCVAVVVGLMSIRQQR